eukprot:4705423-Alexandrium_andersonii.AAC.1
MPDKARENIIVAGISRVSLFLLIKVLPNQIDQVRCEHPPTRAHTIRGHVERECALRGLSEVPKTD